MNILKKKKGESCPVVKREYTHEMVLFILGCTESGKTTTWRQLQLIGEDSFPEDKKYFQKIIYGNTISSINKLLDIAEKHELEITEENKDKIQPVKKIPMAERTERLALTPVNMSEFKLPRFPLRLVYDLKCIWEDEAIQNAYQITLTNPEYHTPGRLQYYMENIFRILSPDFRPTDIDILSAYDATDSLQTSEIYHRKIKINAYCFPASVCDNKKWDACEEAGIPDVIVYIINLSDYDQFFPQNKKQNKLQTAIEVMTDFFTTKTFRAAAHVIVLLNCLDLFMEKTATIDLNCCFSEYTDGLDPEKALAFVNNVLAQKVADKGKTIKVVPLSALEKETLTAHFDELIDLALPSLPLANTSSSSSSSSSTGQTPPTNLHVNGQIQNGEKEKPAAILSDSRGAEKNGKEGAGDGKEKNGVPEKAAEKAGEKPAAENKEKKKKGKRLVSVESGFESVQNRRKTMEDKHIIMDNFRTAFPCPAVPEEEQCLYYGVYDGHGGGETSKIVEVELHKNILTDPAFAAGDYEQAIKNGFLTTDTYILTQPSKSGSTAVIALVVGNQMFVANAGDSECIMCKQIGTGKKSKTEHVVMSYKHVPTDESEKQRISAAGGLVVFGRLFGSLAVSRSFGDRDYKDGGQHFVSAEPHIKQAELTPEDQFLVMACDGLWDKLSYEDVVGTVCRLRKEGKHANDICKALVQDAINKESMDNITVVLVFFNWKK